MAGGRSTETKTNIKFWCAGIAWLAGLNMDLFGLTHVIPLIHKYLCRTALGCRPGQRGAGPPIRTAQERQDRPLGLLTGGPADMLCFLIRKLPSRLVSSVP